MNKDHFAGRANCDCVICRPHMNGPAVLEASRSDREVDVAREPTLAAGPPFPPKRVEPPAHYLKGPSEPWRAWVNADHSFMGPVGATRESFDHKGYKNVR